MQIKARLFKMINRIPALGIEQILTAAPCQKQAGSRALGVATLSKEGGS